MGGQDFFRRIFTAHSYTEHFGQSVGFRVLFLGLCGTPNIETNNELSMNLFYLSNVSSRSILNQCYQYLASPAAYYNKFGLVTNEKMSHYRDQNNLSHGLIPKDGTENFLSLSPIP